MKEKIFNMPKVELHLHLDGSLSIDLLQELSGLTEEEIRGKAISHNSDSLSSYLKCFDFINQYLQTEEALEMASYDLVQRLEKENVIYAEIRFAPILHTNNGLLLDEVVEAVLRGLNKGRIKTNLILCLKRGDSKENNYEIIKLANKYLGKGVCAVDLVGDEDHYPFVNYKSLFNTCRGACIPFTIHAGETGIRDLYEVIHYTKRIGHGIKCVDDNNLVQKIIDRNVLLEVCPNSNIDTKNALNYSSHPIKKLYDLGVKVCINTDNTLVSDITLNEEYYNLYHYFNFTIDDFKRMNIYALEKAFISDEERGKLIDIINKY